MEEKKKKKEKEEEGGGGAGRKKKEKKKKRKKKKKKKEEEEEEALTWTTIARLSVSGLANTVLLQALGHLAGATAVTHEVPTVRVARAQTPLAPLRPRRIIWKKIKSN